MSGQEPDPTGRAEKAIKAELERELEIDDLTWLMSDKRGRRYVWRLLEKAGIYQLSYVPGGDSHATAFREGHRNFGLQQVDQLRRHCPERFSEMQQEAIDHERRLDKRSTRTGTRA